jgi:serine/threonine-protein kinase
MLTENFSSEDESRDGGILRFECADNIEAGGRIIIKKGAAATGKIVDVVSSIRRKKALVGFVILKIQAVDGSSIKLKSERYRRQANVAGQPIAYKSGEFFTAKLGRGRVQ